MLETLVYLTLSFVGIGLALAVFGFWGWMVLDAATRSTAVGRARTAWVLVCLLGGPVGSLVYFLVRRPRGGG